LPEDLIVGAQAAKCFLIREIATFAMRNRHAQKFVGWDLVGERRIRGQGLQEHVFATKLERPVADQSAGKQAGFAENLETVANSQDWPALSGEVLHFLHDGTEAGNCPRPKVIAIAKASGNNYGIGSAQRGLLVPHQSGGMTQDTT
jgi:hypothetical protein